MDENDQRRERNDNVAVSCEGLLIDGNEYYRALFSGKQEVFFEGRYG